MTICTYTGLAHHRSNSFAHSSYCTNALNTLRQQQQRDSGIGAEQHTLPFTNNVLLSHILQLGINTIHHLPSITHQSTR